MNHIHVRSSRGSLNVSFELFWAPLIMGLRGVVKTASTGREMTLRGQLQSIERHRVIVSFTKGNQINRANSPKKKSEL